jgi:signal transduction histidine kinase
VKGPSTLGVRLALAFILTSGAMAVVCVVALVTLVNVSRQTKSVVTQEVDLLRDATAFDALLYQKGYVGDYMLTRDPMWLRKLDDTRAKFEQWVKDPIQLRTPKQREILQEIIRENEAYDRSRRAALDLFAAGRNAEAIAMIPGYHRHIDRLVDLSQQFSLYARRETERSLVNAEQSIRRLAWLLVGTSLVVALSSVTVGYLWARRIARPMYQLQLQFESAAERTKIRLENTTDDAAQLSDQIASLVQKAEEADAALAEQRRRLIQTQKMSAIGEITAKLAHEILNPLAGMKAAVQLMSMQADAGDLSVEGLRPTAEALEREVTRIEQLMRRLIGYARPLAPEVHACPVRSFLDAARDAVQAQLRRDLWKFRYDEQPGIPQLQVDSLLMTQVFVNLYRNAAEAMPEGGAIETRVFASESPGRREVKIEVRDEGTGMSAEQLAHAFTPFRSSKPNGHGLGLATSRNIVVEHGGTLEATNRTDRPGAIFLVSLPLPR